MSFHAISCHFMPFNPTLVLSLHWCVGVLVCCAWRNFAFWHVTWKVMPQKQGKAVWQKHAGLLLRLRTIRPELRLLYASVGVCSEVIAGHAGRNLMECPAFRMPSTSSFGGWGSVRVGGCQWPAGQLRVSRRSPPFARTPIRSFPSRGRESCITSLSLSSEP